MKRLLAAVVAMLVIGPVGAQRGVATPEPTPTPNPTVEGPVGSVGVHGHPWFDPAFETASIGYVQEEFFLSGDARPHTESADAPYKTRIFVVRPATPAAFNGTVVVEWDNVTAQAAFSPMFTWFHQELLRSGYAFVSVSAQAAGVCCGPLSHRAWDPVRYADLSHPGDDYSFDIYSQAIQALVSPQGVAPLATLAVEHVIAVGQSQSASRLHTYVNQVHDAVGLVDGYIIDAGGSKSFDGPPPVPVMHVLSEDGFSAADPNQLGTDTYRLWEIPGASHNDADTARHIDGGQAARNSIDTPQFPYSEDADLHATGLHYGEQGPSSHAGCQVIGGGGNEFPRRYAVQAVLDQLNAWVQSGVAPAQPPRVTYVNGSLQRDGLGHPLGGVRLPPIDVPVARYLATTCALFGETIPLDPATLRRLYPDHQRYVESMRVAIDDAVGAGWMLEADGQELLGLAVASHIPFWAPVP